MDIGWGCRVFGVHKVRVAGVLVDIRVIVAFFGSTVKLCDELLPLSRQGTKPRCSKQRGMRYQVLGQM